MKRSHGFYSKHSRHLSTKRRGITQLLQVFKVGEKVRITADGRAGTIPLRFNGRVVEVVAKQGKGYVVQFNDLDKLKRLVLSKSHLEPMKE